jgi:hypothetical protein
MSGTNEPHASLLLLRGCILLCIGVCLLFALTPVMDHDIDGEPDSLLTDGLLFIPALPAAIVPIFFLTRLPSACFALPRLFSSLIDRPPVTI